MDGKILMVDDNPKNLQVLGNVLKTNGYDVEFATNGKSALDWLDRESFDLILLDIMMPVMDGYEVARKIRENKKYNDLPIIFLTAKVNKESIIKGFESGGQDYISKPFESNELLVRIKTHIELKQSKSELRKLNQDLEKKINERTSELQKLNAVLNESKKKYQYALEASNDGIWDWHLKTDDIELSAGLYRMLGYNSDEFPQLSSEINSRIHPDDIRVSSGLTHLVNYQKDMVELRQDEVRMRTKQGDYIWIRMNGKVVERNAADEICRIIGTFTDITEEKRKNHDILVAILKTEDRERSRISQGIHDGLQQTLTISSLNFEAAQKEYAQREIKPGRKFEVGFKYLQKGIKESRMVAHTLMPKAIMDYGLVSACESLIEQMNMTIVSTDFCFLHNFKGNDIGNKQIEIILYRILQEALNNVIKYAEASKVDVQLKSYDDIIMLTVEDNGIGFNTNDVFKKKNGFGFASMRHRLDAIYGSLDVESKPGKGTTIIIQVEKNKILNI